MKPARTGGALARFISAGLHDADRRLSCFVRRPVAEAPQVVAALESSVVLRAADGALTTVRRAAGSSWIVGVAARTVAAWVRLAPPMQRLAGGVTLLVAVGVHMGLTMWRQAPPGWWWLILPSMAALTGILLIAASGLVGGGTRR